MKIERYPNELEGIKYNLVVFKPSVIDATKKYPLLICLVGIGAKGDNITALEADVPPNVKLAPDSDGFIVVAVQTPDTYDDEILFALDWAFKNQPVSPDSGVYGYGFSYGGGGLWNFIAANAEQAKMFDAVAPIATTWTTIPADGWKYIADAKLQIWAFHNLYDTNPGTPVGATNAYVDATKSTKTLFNVSGHGGWNEAANTVAPPYAPGGQGLTNPSATLWKWFKMNTRTTRVAPPGGTAGLVANGTAILSGSVVTLDGRSSSGYKSAKWRTSAVPKEVNIWGANVDGGGTDVGKLDLKDYVSGAYSFELTVYSGTGYTGTAATKTVAIDWVNNTQPVPATPVKYDIAQRNLIMSDGSGQYVINSVWNFTDKTVSFVTEKGTHKINL